MKDLSETDIKDLLQYKNIVAVSVVIIAALLFVNNSYSGYQNDLRKIKDQEKALEQAKTELQRWEEAKNKYNQLVDVFFKDNSIAFKRYVEEKAKNTNVTIDSLRTSRREKDFYQEAVIQLGLDSSYKDLVNFIAELEKRNIDIKNMSLRKAKDKELRVNLDLKAVLVEK
ncbi:MAG: type 4a pilus biogenesis protein PilO [Candidatus Omnitrophica bacterium]|nr:type 4a pilus biogenesis protein PilO [Candidatus Omnitrophota bacterium]MCF7887958.1 type 4a pilus biogenesis protein PilO [Candidatus Omnitrophota bacterium]